MTRLRANLSQSWPIALVIAAGIVSCLAYWSNDAGGRGVAARNFPLDDGWIHLVYARSLATSLRPDYNSGVLESGMTSPLWAVLNAVAWWPGHLLRLNPTVAPKCLSLLFATASCVMLFRLARRRNVPTLITLVPALLVAVDPEWTFSAASGMEPTLAAFLTLLAADAVDRGAWTTAGWSSGFAIATRPELAMLVPLLLLCAAVQLPDWRRRVRAARAIALPAILVSGLWIGYNLVATGRPLPNSFYVKAQTVELIRSANLLSLLAILGRTAFLSRAFGLVAVLAGFVVLARAIRRNVLLVASPLAFVLGLSVTHTFVQTWPYYWARYAHPVLPFLALPIAVAASAAAGKLAWRPAVPVLGTLALLGCGYPAVHRLPESARLFSRNCRDIEIGTVAAGRWIAANTSPGDRIAAMNAGAIRYFGERATIDMVGLNTYEMIGVPSWTDALLALRPDDVILVPGVAPGLVADLQLQPALVLPNPDLSICDCPSQSTLVVFRAPWARGGTVSR